MLHLWIIYVISVFFLLCFHARLFVDALWSLAGEGLASWLSFVMSNCDVVTFTLVSWVRVWCLIVSIPDICPLSYFEPISNFGLVLELHSTFVKLGHLQASCWFGTTCDCFLVRSHAEDFCSLFTII